MHGREWIWRERERHEFLFENLFQNNIFLKFYFVSLYDNFSHYSNVIQIKSRQN